MDGWLSALLIVTGLVFGVPALTILLRKILEVKKSRSIKRRRAQMNSWLHYLGQNIDNGSFHSFSQHPSSVKIWLRLRSSGHLRNNSHLDMDNWLEEAYRQIDLHYKPGVSYSQDSIKRFFASISAHYFRGVMQGTRK